MPSIACRCGEPLKYGELPNRIEWLLVSDTEFDQFAGQVDAERVYERMTHALRCPHCGRFWVFWNGFGAEPQEFTPLE
jgi:hypothetical protein